MLPVSVNTAEDIDHLRIHNAEGQRGLLSLRGHDHEIACALQHKRVNLLMLKSDTVEPGGRARDRVRNYGSGHVGAV